MNFISKMLILSLSILVLQSSTTWSRELGNHQVKTVTFMTTKFEVGPGMVVKRAFWDVEFPKGHIGVKSFDAELVDEQGNSVPLHETYLHHFFALRYWENITFSQNPLANRTMTDGKSFKGNAGLCQEGVLVRVEAQGTSSNIPDPFAMELGVPDKGWEEKWLIEVMAIDSRGVQDREGCTQCRCDLYNVTKDYLANEKGIDGKPLTDYKGGIFCCRDNSTCKLQKDFHGPKRNLSLKYTIKYVDWDQYQVPVNFYVLDVVDQVTYNGSQPVHQCLVSELLRRCYK